MSQTIRANAQIHPKILPEQSQAHDNNCAAIEHSTEAKVDSERGRHELPDKPKVELRRGCEQQ